MRVPTGAGTLPANHLFMFATSLPRHVAGQSLGMPHTPRALSFSLPSSEDLIEVANEYVPFTESDAYATVATVLPRMVSSVDDANSRVQPTVRVSDRTFRRGVEAPAKSNLAFFVLIGLVVGLFAFAAMTLALPENEMTAATTKVAPPVAVAAPVVDVAPAVTAPTTVISSDAVSTPDTSVVLAKPSPTRRRASFKRPATTTKVSLPANPYNAP